MGSEQYGTAALSSIGLRNLGGYNTQNGVLVNMKKAIPVIVAILLIIVIGAAYFGKILYDKYSYSKETVDMNEYYQVSGEQSAIILQDEMVEEKAIIRGNVCYLDLATVHKYLNEIFYVDYAENLLLYTTATETVRVNLGETSYSTDAGNMDVGYTIAYVENDTVYVALDYVKQYTNFSYDVYDRHIQVYTQWGSKEIADIAKDTAVRERGGVKSPILREIMKGETVEILETMETWSKVKTSDSIIGYVENKRLTGISAVEETPVKDYVAPEYTSIAMEGKVSLGWHAIGGVGGNDTLESMVAGTKGMNVIAPTWFSLNDNEGNFRSFASSDYVRRAHNMGLQVWGVLDDFNYNNETDGGIDVYSILSSTTKRQYLAQNITNTAVSLGLDGINLDFERVSSDTGVHYIQFLRELSILCRQNQLVLSIDNYVPFNFNDYYRLDIQGQVADYVIIMGYDEHWHGSGDPGSVASIDYVSNGIDKTLEDVPAQKVINALPFYTILWKTDGSTVTDSYLTIVNTEDFVSRLGLKPEWDETTCQNYAEWTEGSATYQIWLEDLESIKVKLNVMGTKDIGGVAVWRLGYGTPAVWELLNAYSNS
uniref:glycosyl hydrolase family 18 protein n=1 Tax=Acetatifactor sp. TaxID=1872090 RepID=UPI0040578AF5